MAVGSVVEEALSEKQKRGSRLGRLKVKPEAELAHGLCGDLGRCRRGSVRGR